MKDEGKFVECAQVYGRWYGVPRSQVTSALESGKDVILKIDVQGAATVREMAPDALFIFMVPGGLFLSWKGKRLLKKLEEKDPKPAM